MARHRPAEQWCTALPVAPIVASRRLDRARCGFLEFGLGEVFRKRQKGKHRATVPSTLVFAFPEISRENRGCLVLHSGNSRLSLTPESESWSGAKSEAKSRKPAASRAFSRYTRVFPGIPAKYPVFCRFCRFCHQEGTPTRFDFREATGIPYHFLISAGLGFD